MALDHLSRQDEKERLKKRFNKPLYLFHLTAIIKYLRTASPGKVETIGGSGEKIASCYL